ncbi:MAG: hypothetical protein MZV64_63365 [Ignavibacteriales bacterium]|nr:hypothetical protein [Ignavibacteriales bacterium]
MRMAIRTPKIEMEARPTSLTTLTRSPTVRTARTRSRTMPTAAKKKSR